MAAVGFPQNYFSTMFYQHMFWWFLEDVWSQFFSSSHRCPSQKNLRWPCTNTRPMKSSTKMARKEKMAPTYPVAVDAVGQVLYPIVWYVWHRGASGRIHHGFSLHTSNMCRHFSLKVCMHAKILGWKSWTSDRFCTHTLACTIKWSDNDSLDTSTSISTSPSFVI